MALTSTVVNRLRTKIGDELYGRVSISKPKSLASKDLAIALSVKRLKAAGKLHLLTVQSD